MKCFKTLLPLILILISIKMNGQWAALNTTPVGVNNTVRDIVIYNNQLVLGGLFTSAGGVSCNKLAIWNGVNFSSMPNTPIQYDVIDLYVDGNMLYVIESNAASVHRWDGVSWTNLGTQLNGTLFTMIVYNSELYVGGNFTLIGSSSVNNVAKWNGTSWQSVGSGFSNAVINFEIYNNQLYACGMFQNSGSNNVNNIARWNGSSWVSVGGGANDWIGIMKVYNGELYASGYFTTIGGISANQIAKWNGTVWTTLTPGVIDYFGIADMEVYNNELYVGGHFSTIGSLNSQFFAKWNGSQWNTVGSGTVDNIVYTLNIFNGDLYVGGAFTGIGSTLVNRIAKWTSLVDIDELENSQNVEIYPNPVTDKIQISTRLPEIGLTEIFDLAGKKVKEKLINSNKSEIDISELENGFYFLRNGEKSFKIVKQ